MAPGVEMMLIHEKKVLWKAQLKKSAGKRAKRRLDPVFWGELIEEKSPRHAGVESTGFELGVPET